MAFISEIHYKNSYANNSGNAEFVEITLSPAEAARAGDFQMATYHANGSVAAVFTLTDAAVTVTIDPITGYHVYTMDTVVTDPNSGEAEAVSLVDNSLPSPDNVLTFVDIGGGTTNITATNGPADGATSTNIPPAAGNRSIQFDIDGNRIDGPFTEGTSVTCFVAGTLINTPDGEKRVQDLRVGGLVSTHSRGAQKIRWIGQSHVSEEKLQRYPNLRPVCIKAGTLATNTPTRDLRVSQQHKMLLSDPMLDLHYGASDFLVKAKDIARRFENAYTDTPDHAVNYFHLLFDTHEIIFANGCPSESFYPGDEAMKAIDSNQMNELLQLFPEFKSGNNGYRTLPIGRLKSWEVAVINTP